MKMYSGLSTPKAQRLLEAVGPNEIVQKPSSTPFTMFIEQFKSPLVVILLLATLASLFLGDALEGVLIFLIVIVNAVLGFLQEYRAERSLAALKKMTVATTRVIRDGVQKEIDSRLLVPEDIIVLEEGDKIPADARLIESMHLEVNEASLTGESLPVEKGAGEKDKSLAFMGTIVAKGRATAQVTATGMNTRLGKIASSLTEIVKEETPLTVKLAEVARYIGVAALLAAVAIFTIGYLKNNPLIEMVLTGISLAVAAVPEGLPTVITITLALGTQRMARRKAILRKLAAIEALGSVTIIATDKTGTLTGNIMRVTRVWIEDKSYLARDEKLSRHPTFSKLLTVAVLCNNASLTPARDHDGHNVVGDVTEGSLLLLAANHKIDPALSREEGKLLEEFAFDPTTKTMTVVWKNASGTHILTKGAPEAILERSRRVITKDGERPLTYQEKKRLEKAFQEFAKEGLRVIAFASRKVVWEKQNREKTESNLTFLGFVGIMDPPREEVAEAIQIAQTAGIKTIMITGDNELTAYAIARQINLIKKGDEVLTGAQFASFTEEEAKVHLDRVRVLARTTPEQKFAIVKLLQEKGHVVAVTGDGVNDALALKQAHVGVAMGITGTDVAKEAAEMIVTDDNYATIVAAVEEGRAIFDNMKAAIKYLIGCNIGEILAILGGAIIGWPFILAPLHILYVNLATDSLQAIALAVNPKHPTLMKRQPRTEKTLFNRFDLRWFAEVSLVTALVTLAAFFWGWHAGNVVLGRTLAFTVLILAQQFIYLDIASGDHSILAPRTRKSKWLFLPLGIFVVQLFLIYTPLFQQVFKLTPPAPSILLVSLLTSFGVLVVSELRKRSARRLFYGN